MYGEVKDLLDIKIFIKASDENRKKRFLERAEERNQSVENALGGNVRQVFNLKKGLSQENAKKITGIIKDTKLKVQASIQGEQVRVSGKSRDDLQQVIQVLRSKEDELNLPLQFTNYR